jgi:glycosyltransferase involved in cell wall biosynthesis
VQRVSELRAEGGSVMRLVKHGTRGRVLYVAYPLLPVDAASCGGAEQVLQACEQEAHAGGWQTTVAACSGSVAVGSVYATGAPAHGSLTTEREIVAEHCHKVLELIAVRNAVTCGFDVVHDHSGGFFTCADRVDEPVIATLHLPREFYPASAFRHLPANLHLVCVSQNQARTFRGVAPVQVIRNGVRLEQFPLETHKQDYLLWMGRICEEKGPHIALDVAAEVGMKIVLAGKVFPFAYHQEYFRREIEPRLAQMGDQAVHLVDITAQRKSELLRNAKAVLIPSTVAETSSLVAMEAAASGTPVIAFKQGALAEVVQSGETGIIVNDTEQMTRAVGSVSRLRPRTCHGFAHKHFSSKRMFHEYEQLYEEVSTRTALPAQLAA